MRQPLLMSMVGSISVLIGVMLVLSNVLNFDFLSQMSGVMQEKDYQANFEKRLSAKILDKATP